MPPGRVHAEGVQGKEAGKGPAEADFQGNIRNADTEVEQLMAGTVLNMIGLARRARQVESGDAAVRSAVGRNKVRLIILAEDAAERTRKAFELVAGDAGIPLISYGSKINLGRILNKPSRSVVAIIDDNFARAIVMAMEKGGGKA